MNSSKFTYPPMLVIGLSLAIASIGSAMAQDEDPPTAPESKATLEEILVTARRRTEKLQDVPIAITALSAEALDRRQVLSTLDLDRVTPSMQFTSYGQLSGNNSAAVVFIRGVGQLDPTPSVDPGVGIYVDDVYMGRAVDGSIDFYDIESIQVLRGPQGTLFGRNTIGGAVLINTVIPGDEFEGKMRGRVGEDSLWEVFGAVTLPASEDLAFRFALGARQRDGYVKRVYDGQDLGNEDILSVRGTMRWDLADDMQLIVKADYSRQDENGAPFVFKGMNTRAAVPAIVSVAAGCPGATIPFAPIVPGDPRFGPPNVPEIPDSRCANNFWNLGPYTNGGTAAVESTKDSAGISANFAWDINDSFDLNSITAYRDLDWTGIRDADNTPFVIITTDYTSESTQFSQELRLNYSSDRLAGVMGAYYFGEDTNDRVTVPLAFPPSPPVIASLLAGGPGSRDLQYVNLTTDSFAVFTEWSFDLTEALSVSGGLRYTSDEKSIKATVMNLFPATLPDPNPLPTAAIPDGGPLFIYPDRFSETYDKVNYSASVRYSFNQGWMAYASYATSFKSGGFNQRYNAPPPGFVPVSFDEETVASIEVGFKADVTDTLRVNTALFWSDYDDIQTIYRQGVVPLLFNAGKASINGVELEFWYEPIDRFILEGGFSYLDDKIKEITQIPGTVTGVGPDNTLPYTPDWQWNLAISYRFGLWSGWNLSPRIDAAYTDSQYFDAENTAITAQLDSVTTVNLGVVLNDDAGKWEIGLYFQNLTDELYPVQGNASLGTLGYAEQVYARGRNWYLGVNYNF
ncbi:MAG TPA: TonB-dependent receptor [Xanthomonadales bacterium]|nr:TonB-dependent receptor [Xanthomonadales bacterium]